MKHASWRAAASTDDLSEHLCQLFAAVELSATLAEDGMPVLPQHLHNLAQAMRETAAELGWRHTKLADTVAAKGSGPLTAQTAATQFCDALYPGTEERCTKATDHEGVHQSYENGIPSTWGRYCKMRGPRDGESVHHCALIQGHAGDHRGVGDYSPHWK